MKDDKRAEALLRAFYRREVDIEAERRTRGGTAPREQGPAGSSGLSGTSLARPLIAAAASLILIAGTPLLGGRGASFNQGAQIFRGELVQLAEEGGVLIPFRAVLSGDVHRGGAE